MTTFAARFARTLVALAAALFLTATLTPSALAQAPRPISRVEFGWNSTITAGRWTPVRAWIDGSVATSGNRLTLEYDADRTQRALLVVPASPTPGKLTPVDFAACIPASPGAIRLTFERDYVDFRPPATSGETAAPLPGETRLGQFFGPNQGLLVSVDLPALQRAFPAPLKIERSPSVGPDLISNPTSMTGEYLTEFRWRQLAATAVEHDALPLIPQAYEGLEALILDAPRTAAWPPRLREAILDWVTSGGRLILIATDDSAAWRQWLPLNEPDPIVAASPARLAAPDFAAKVLGHDILTVKVTPREHATAYERQIGSEPEYTRERPHSVAIRPEFTARAFSLTEAGRALGWTIRWDTPAASNSSDSAPTGLIAYGPVGLGMVTILGVNPETIPDALDAQASHRLWRSALELPLHRYLETPFTNADSSGEAVVTAALNALISVPHLGNAIFLIILISLILLGLILGPIDWFVLKRYRARQHSWLVALGWILLASVAGFVIPPRLRSGPPQLNRLAALDILQAENSLISPAHAWQEGLSGIFASGPLQLAIDQSPDSPHLGSWWHGVAPSDGMNWRRNFSTNERRGVKIFDSLLTIQASTPDRKRQNTPIQFHQPTWSYRTLADSNSAAQTPIRAAVERGADGYDVRISGIIDPDRIAALRVTTRETLAAKRENAAPPSARFTDTKGQTLTAKAPATYVHIEDEIYGGYSPIPPPASRSAEKARDAANAFWPSKLPHPLARTAAVDARVASGRWALVEVVLNAPVESAAFLSEETLKRYAFQESGLSAIRILVPLATATPGADSSKEPTP